MNCYRCVAGRWILLCALCLCWPGLLAQATDNKASSEIEEDAYSPAPTKTIKSPVTKPSRVRLNREKLEAYIQRGLEDGSLSLDRLHQLEKRYLRQDFRYEPHSNTHPYIPHKWDYGIEIGQMNIDKDLYWIGGNLGYNLGTCVLTRSPTCQQYFDFLLGSSGRDAETNWYGVVSLRWQFVNFPKTTSPLLRVFTGGMNRIANDRSQQFFIYGLGAGVTTYLHPRADLRVEARSGWGGDIGNFHQIFVSVELKLSRWLDFFAGKLEGVGRGAGRILQKGVSGTGGVLQRGIEETGQILVPGRDSTNVDDPSLLPSSSDSNPSAP